jgi:hypothetical protein
VRFAGSTGTVERRNARLFEKQLCLGLQRAIWSRQLAAIGGVIQRWLEEQPAGAQEWILQQPPGKTRDQVLELMLSSSAAGDDLDYDRLIDAFDSEVLAQRSVMVAIENALSDPYAPPNTDRAEALLEFISDPAMRHQAEERIASFNHT